MYVWNGTAQDSPHTETGFSVISCYCLAVGPESIHFYEWSEHEQRLWPILLPHHHLKFSWDAFFTSYISSIHFDTKRTFLVRQIWTFLFLSNVYARRKKKTLNLTASSVYLLWHSQVLRYGLVLKMLIGCFVILSLFFKIFELISCSYVKEARALSHRKFIATSCLQSNVFKYLEWIKNENRKSSNWNISREILKCLASPQKKKCSN